MSEAAPMELGEALEIFFRTPAQYQKSRRFTEASALVKQAVFDIARRVARGSEIDAEELAQNELLKMWRLRDSRAEEFGNQGENAAKKYLRIPLERRMSTEWTRKINAPSQVRIDADDDRSEALDLEITRAASTDRIDTSEQSESKKIFVDVLSNFVAASNTKNRERNELVEDYYRSILRGDDTSTWTDERLQREGKDPRNPRERNSFQKRLGNGRRAFEHFVAENPSIPEHLRAWALVRLDEQRGSEESAR